MAARASQDSSPRPYWHVDAKWIFGLLFLLSWSLTLLAFSFFQLTRPATAIAVGGELLAGMTELGGAEAEEESAAEFRAQVEAVGEDGLRPFPGTDVRITADDLEGKSSDEIRSVLFGRVAEEVYWNGAEAVAAGEVGPDPISTLGLMALLTEETHQKVRTVIFVLLGVDTLWLLGVLGFSWGGGRLTTPGMALLLAGLPGTIMTQIVLETADGAGEEGVGALASQLFLPVVEITSRTYRASLGLGVGLIVAGLLWGLVRHLRGRPGPSPTTSRLRPAESGTD